jgi:hypothetical protein
MSKKPKSKKPVRPVRSTPATTLSPEAQQAADAMCRLARENPDGWAMLAEALKQFFAQSPELEPDGMLAFLVQGLGKEALPLLRGLSLDEDEALAHAALKALPLLGTRAAGDVLVEAFAAHPDGERGRLAWQGASALQARGINVQIPEPEGARQAVPAYQLRETWETLPDGVGSRQAAARFQDRYGVWHAAMLVWNDRAGVKESVAQAISRHDWGQIRQRLGDQGILFAQVPPDYARWSVARAREINGRTGFPLGENLETWDEWVGPPPEGYEPPDPLEAARAVPEADRAARLEAAERVFDTDVFENWAVEPADTRPWLEEWEAVPEDEEGPEADAADAQAEAILARAADAVMTAEIQAQYRERLLDTARKLEWLKRPSDALDVALLLQEMEAAASPGQARFYREMVAHSLLMLQEILEDGDDPEELRYDPMQVAEPEDGAEDDAEE